MGRVTRIFEGNDGNIRVVEVRTRRRRVSTLYIKNMCITDPTRRIATDRKIVTGRVVESNLSTGGGMLSIELVQIAKNPMLHDRSQALH